ncbi:fatty acid desaturase [Candidatus Poriferisocius sp.]|uniref:fatty acid desaturase n=1 Tax=Candidatus Poriferisocius sp. TaxID=3101276 RepID=UPI003B5B1149
MGVHFVQIVMAVIVGLALTQLANLATTVYLHRDLAHRAVQLNPVLRAFFKVFLWMATGICARQWAAVHRKHHAFTDEVEDPHSPARLGWVRVQLTNAALYRRSARDPRTTERYARDIPVSRADRFLLNRGIVGLGLGVAILVLWLGWLPGVVAAVVHTVGYIGLGGSVNGVAHTFGRRPFDNSATNVTWLAWLTCGEGYHNNHHAAPTSARFARRWYHFDLGWWFISAAQRLRLARVRHHDVDSLANRPTVTAPA